MTLKDLKQKATASELTLIEATEALLREDVTTTLRRAAMDFLSQKLPPSKDELRFSPDAAARWLEQFHESHQPMSTALTFPTIEAAVSALCEKAFGAPCIIEPPQYAVDDFTAALKPGVWPAGMGDTTSSLKPTSEITSEFAKHMEEAQEDAISDMEEEIHRLTAATGSLHAIVDIQRTELVNLRAIHSRLVDMLGSEDTVTAVRELIASSESHGIPDLVITDKDMDPTEGGRYRMLGEGDKMLPGDEVYVSDMGWIPAQDVSWHPHQYYRRPVQDTPPEPKQEYRTLAPDEILQEGDEFLTSFGFQPTNYVGHRVGVMEAEYYRRPIRH